MLESKNKLPVRKEHDLPLAIEQWGWKFHHLGIPTTLKLPEEKYIPHLKFYVSGFSTSPFGIEWMRFDDDCPLNSLIQTVPHLAFEVADVEIELLKRNFKVMVEPNSPAPGIRVAMIEHNGAPIELIEFSIK
jgi:hypothetical protein